MDMQYTQMCTAGSRLMPDNFEKEHSNPCTSLQSSQISDSTNTDEWEDLNEEEEFFLQQVEATYKDRSFSEKQDSEEKLSVTEAQIEHDVGQKTAHEKEYCVEDAACSTPEMHKNAENLELKIKKSTDADTSKEKEVLECAEMKEEIKKLPEFAESQQDYCAEDAACSTPEMEYVRLATEMNKNAEQSESKTKQSTDTDMSKEMEALQSKEIKEEIRQLQQFAEAEQDPEKQEANQIQQKQFLIDMRSLNLKTKRQRTEQEEDCKEERMKKKRKQGVPKWIAWMIRYC